MQIRDIRKYKRKAAAKLWLPLSVSHAASLVSKELELKYLEVVCLHLRYLKLRFLFVLSYLTEIECLPYIEELLTFHLP